MIILRKLRGWLFSLEGKFMLTAVLCIAIFSAATGFTILSREEQLYRTDSFHQSYTISEISRLMLTNVMVYNEMGMIDRKDLIDYLDYFILDLMERDKRVINAMVFDPNGAALADSNPSDFKKENHDEYLLQAFETLMPTYNEGEFAGQKGVMITTPLNINTKTWGALRIVFSTVEVDIAIKNLRNQIMLLALGVLLVSLIIVKFVARRLAKPVVMLTNMMDSVQNHGDLEVKKTVFVSRQDELGKLQNSFFWFLKRLQEADREREKVMEQLVQTEKMVAIGHLSSGVAHEINNPLGGITICFKSLLKFTKNTAETRELEFAIEDGLKKIKRIVAQLLDFSRASDTEKGAVDVNDLINRILFLLRHDARKCEIDFRLELDETMPLVFVDENKIAQVIMNLTINAIQAMANGGILTICTKLEEDHCCISFRDTGEGIQPETMPFIFDPFFTTKKTGEGTGLGLSVSRGIIEQHGGKMSVESLPGSGTTFTIRLPVTQEHSEGLER